MTQETSNKKIVRLWYGAGSFVLLSSLFMTWQSHLFGYDFEVINMPLLPLAIGLVVLGLIFLSLPWLIKKTLRLFPDTPALCQQKRQLLWFILLIGLLSRLIFFWSTPLMEDDFQRYLWDGAVTAHGYNPYSVNPAKILNGSTRDVTLKKLSLLSAPVLERVNHPQLRTIYPPVAQGAFALAYYIAPWKLGGWRFVALLCELSAIGFLLALLSGLGRSPLWISLYWWNPLILKELANSAHMDVLLVPFVIGAFYLAGKKHFKAASFFILMATAIKLWPAILLPVLLRPLWPDWKKIALYLTAFIIALSIIMSPIVLAGLDQSSGFVAYVQKWQTNSALFPLIKSFWGIVLSPLGLSIQSIGLLSRLFIVIIIGLTALALSWKPITDQKDLLVRGFIISATMFLLSPAQFPWYGLWVLPFAVLFPVTGILMLTALLPIYYVGFYLMSIGRHDLFTSVAVWVIWLPVWLALIGQFRSVLAQKIPFLQARNSA